jgi:hypothetical protein
MQRLIGKVTGPPSLLHDTCSSANSSIIVCVAMTARLEATEKALAEERAAWPVVDQSLAVERAARQAIDHSLRAS